MTTNPTTGRIVAGRIHITPTGATVQRGSTEVARLGADWPDRTSAVLRAHFGPCARLGGEVPRLLVTVPASMGATRAA